MNYPMNYSGTFAEIYSGLLAGIKSYPTNVICNNNNMLYELLNVTLTIDIVKDGSIPQVSIYSCADTRAVPIGFVLAEFATILTDDTDIKHLAKFNKNILNYVEYGTKASHYGTRLYSQLPKLLILLTKDKHTRKACANIWYAYELDLKHQSCNVFLQFIIRDNKLNLIVVSRSSDLLTGLIIDAVHWQLLLISFYWQLIMTVYPALDIGSVIYKISSLHVYATERELMYTLPKRQHGSECISQYEHNLPFYKTFSWLRSVAADVKQCYGLNDLTELYLFDGKQIDVINQLRAVYKSRKFNIIR